MKGGLDWQVGRGRVADTNAVSGAEGVGSAGGAKVAGGTKDKAGGRGVWHPCNPKIRVIRDPDTGDIPHRPLTNRPADRYFLKSKRNADISI